MIKAIIFHGKKKKKHGKMLQSSLGKTPHPVMIQVTCFLGGSIIIPDPVIGGAQPHLALGKKGGSSLGSYKIIMILSLG